MARGRRGSRGGNKKMMLVGLGAAGFLLVSSRGAHASPGGINPLTGQPYASGSGATNMMMYGGGSANDLGSWLAAGKSIYDVGKAGWDLWKSEPATRGDVGGSGGGDTTSGGSLSDRLRPIDPWNASPGEAATQDDPIDTGDWWKGGGGSVDWSALPQFDATEGMQDPWAPDGGGLAGRRYNRMGALARRGYHY